MQKTKTDLEHSLPCVPRDMEDLKRQLLEIRAEMLRQEARYKGLGKIHPAHRNSARNLLHYMALRLHDVRDLQLLLAEWGLSSLGRAERKVQATIDTMLHVMHRLKGQEWKPREQPPICFREGRRQLEENTTNLLGEVPSGRRVRIMVTLPTEAADNYGLVYNFMESGMNCARINCAHDDPAVWSRMIANIRKAEEIIGRKCRILMDLGGPKLRTGTLEPGPAVVKVRPKRNELGQVMAPAYIWLYPEESTEKMPDDSDARFPVPGDWLRQLKQDDRILLTDSRDANRRLKVVSVQPDGCWATSSKTIYFTTGMALEIKRKNGKPKNKKARLIGELQRTENTIVLHAGDQLCLTRSNAPGRPAYLDKNGTLQPATIGCSIPDVLDDVRMGEPVWFDDGKIGGVIERVEQDKMRIRITQARPDGEKLRSEKGINLPESDLSLTALTDDDLRDLKFVVQHADMVGLSFANSPKDVENLIKQIEKLMGAKSNDPVDSASPARAMPGIVLKIETRLGFDNLPAMLLAAMQIPKCGVMIARGDLAIECGFGRLAEVQEQILWICEAAHVPVIWATQVLEGLAKQGLPSRAEVTDAAMGQRAECIMLNKGEHIVEATKALGDILQRMQDHQTKKRSLLRRLQLAEKFFEKMEGGK